MRFPQMSRAAAGGPAAGRGRQGEAPLEIGDFIAAAARCLEVVLGNRNEQALKRA